MKPRAEIASSAEASDDMKPVPTCQDISSQRSRGTFAIGDGRYFVTAGTLRKNHENGCEAIMKLLHDKHNATATSEACEQDTLFIDGQRCGELYSGNLETMAISDYYNLYYGSCRPSNDAINARGLAAKDDLAQYCASQRGDSTVALGVAGGLGVLFLVLLACACYRSRRAKTQPKASAERDVEAGFTALPGGPAEDKKERKDSLGNGANGVFANNPVANNATPPSGDVSFSPEYR